MLCLPEHTIHPTTIVTKLVKPGLVKHVLKSSNRSATLCGMVLGAMASRTLKKSPV
jgi:hypothetical protein